MANPTSNFGWQMPTNTDLVKDLPADFETFGQAVDTSMADLKGGTTGQILSKNSNTDMDFVWIANDQGDITAVTAGTGLSGGGTSGAVTITNDMATTITAAGDLVVGTGSGTYDNLPIGTTGQVLTADTTVSPYKVKWASAGGGGKVLQVVSTELATTFSVANSTSFSDVTGLSVSITPSSSSSKVLVFYNLALFNTTGTNLGFMRLVRNSTAISQGTASGSRTVATGGTDTLNSYAPFPAVAGHYLDSPATTSATTYKITIGSGTSSGTLYVNRSSTDDDQSNRPRFASVITAMEIGA